MTLSKKSPSMLWNEQQKPCVLYVQYCTFVGQANQYDGRSNLWQFMRRHEEERRDEGRKGGLSWVEEARRESKGMWNERKKDSIVESILYYNDDILIYKYLLLSLVFFHSSRILTFSSFSLFSLFSSFSLLIFSTTVLLTLFLPHSAHDCRNSKPSQKKNSLEF